MSSAVLAPPEYPNGGPDEFLTVGGVVRCVGLTA